jgi:hypothetical protein
MKSRLTLIFAALTVLLGTMVWIVNDRPLVDAAPAIAVERTVVVRVATAAGPAPAPTTAPVAAVATPAPRIKTPPMVYVDASGGLKYVAREGDTVSQLAIAMLGSDSKANRDAVIANSASLQANPDHVLAGETYSVAVSAPAVEDDAASAEQASDNEATPETAGATAGPNLEYTAQRGDTVRGLASHLLGGDTKANREGIIAENPSLQQDPDHLVAGQSYTIVARNGLSADPDAPPARTPTTQPEADEVARLSVGRMLGYKAQPGDTVSKLAVVLLGKDTRANRELILRSNFSLRQHPDALIAGTTYWISAPTSESKP